MYLDVRPVPGCALCTWMCAMYLYVHHVPGCAPCTWMCAMYLDVHPVPGCAPCTWMCAMYLDVRHVAEDGEDEHSGQEAGTRVHHARDYRVPEAVLF